MTRRRQGAQPVGSLFADLLPEDFTRQRVLIEQYQQFFNQLESDPVLSAVRVLHVGEPVLSLAVPSPAQGGWLRQHRRELEQALSEQFGKHHELNVRVDPAMMTPAKPAPRMTAAQPVSEQTVERIERSARSLGDDALGQAMRRLAESLKKHCRRDD